MEEKPIHKHDCTACVFLGNYEYTHGEKGDLYLCSQELGFGVTLVARFSSDGPDYRSGLVFGVRAEARGDHNYPLAVAYRKALEKGLLTRDHPAVQACL